MLRLTPRSTRRTRGVLDRHPVVVHGAVARAIRVLALGVDAARGGVEVVAPPAPAADPDPQDLVDGLLILRREGVALGLVRGAVGIVDRIAVVVLVRHFVVFCRWRQKGNVGGGVCVCVCRWRSRALSFAEERGREREAERGRVRVCMCACRTECLSKNFSKKLSKNLSKKLSTNLNVFEDGSELCECDGKLITGSGTLEVYISVQEGAPSGKGSL